MIKTALQRQQDAERELWHWLKTGSRDRLILGDLLRSVLSTAEATARRPGPPLPNKTHRGFAEDHPDFFRRLGIYTIDAIRLASDPKIIYRGVRRRAARLELKLSVAPWEIKPGKKAAA